MQSALSVDVDISGDSELWACGVLMQEARKYLEAQTKQIRWQVIPYLKLCPPLKCPYTPPLMATEKDVVVTNSIIHTTNWSGNPRPCSASWRKSHCTKSKAFWRSTLSMHLGEILFHVYFINSSRAKCILSALDLSFTNVACAEWSICPAIYVSILANILEITS